MIHQFIQNGYHIALDVNSGAVHVLDELSYRVLEKVEPPMDKQCPSAIVDALKEKYPTEEIQEAYGELYQLYEADMLFSEDDYAAFADKMIVSPIKAMCLHVAHDCNLRCEYCFAAKGDFGGERKLMPLEVGKKAIDFLIERSGSRRNLELDFFGGEPLMNFNVVKQVVAYARSKEKKYNKNY